jgi:hypothetical protein
MSTCTIICCGNFSFICYILMCNCVNVNIALRQRQKEVCGSGKFAITDVLVIDMRPIMHRQLQVNDNEASSTL